MLGSAQIEKTIFNGTGMVMGKGDELVVGCDCRLLYVGWRLFLAVICLYKFAHMPKRSSRSKARFFKK